MKYILSYESKTNENEPSVGDFVICKEHDTATDKVVKFVNNNIGILQKITGAKYGNYIVGYDNIPQDLAVDNFNFPMNNRSFNREEIIHFSKNKKELENK